MPAPATATDAISDHLPEDLVEVGVYASVSEGFDHGLVALAEGWPFWLVPVDRSYRLFVEPPAVAAVREQLLRFDRESLHWPPPAEAIEAGNFEIMMPLGWALLVLAVYWVQGAWPGRWEESGALDTQALFDGGEWWRPGTALFLHADLGHLVSNLFSGVFVFSALLSTLGRWRGWLLLALASLTGNVASAALSYPGPYRSLGASTAIFAGLGLLSGRAIRVVRQRHPTHRWRDVFVPLAAGITLLGLFGAGGIEVDVGAHATGFAAGLVWGFMAGLAKRSPPARPYSTTKVRG
jgi:membrane associated rhomboid family serine protease